MTLFNYDRKQVVSYLQNWTKTPPTIYPDLTLLFGNNIQFIYQCLINGGFYFNGSNFYDFYNGQSYPVISKFSNLEKSLLSEIKATKVITTDYEERNNLNSGDFAFTLKNNQGVYGCAVEKTNAGRVFYGVDPIIYAGSLPVGDSYIFYQMPETGNS